MEASDVEAMIGTESVEGDPAPVLEPGEGSPEATAEDPEEPTQAAEPEARSPTPEDLKRYESENTRHERALAKIVGEDWQDFVPCEACGAVGFAPRPPEELLQLVKAEGVMECPTCVGAGGTECATCAGKGGLEYPTKVEGQRFQRCPSCGGTGRNVCVDCAGNGWKREAAAPVEVAAGGYPPPGNGGSGTPPGYILVKVDPNAPDYVPAPATPGLMPAASPPPG